MHVEILLTMRVARHHRHAYVHAALPNVAAPLQDMLRLAHYPADTDLVCGLDFDGGPTTPDMTSHAATAAAAAPAVPAPVPAVSAGVGTAAAAAARADAFKGTTSVRVGAAAGAGGRRLSSSSLDADSSSGSSFANGSSNGRSSSSGSSMDEDRDAFFHAQHDGPWYDRMMPVQTTSGHPGHLHGLFLSGSGGTPGSAARHQTLQRLQQALQQQVEQPAAGTDESQQGNTVSRALLASTTAPSPASNSSSKPIGTGTAHSADNRSDGGSSRHHSIHNSHHSSVSGGRWLHEMSAAWPPRDLPASLVSAHAALQHILMRELAHWAHMQLPPWGAGPMPQYAFYDIWVARDRAGRMVSMQLIYLLPMTSTRQTPAAP